MSRGSSPTDFAHLFPSYEATMERVRASSPHFFRCPGGHDIPHRRPWGRCTPVVCVDTEGRTEARPDPDTDEYAVEKALTPLGCDSIPDLAEGADLARTTRLKAQNAAALSLMEVLGENAARDALMAVPAAPPLPDFKAGGRSAVTQYMDDLAPVAAAKLGQRLLYGSRREQIDAAQEVLDRAGYPRRKEALPQLRAPVIINLGGATLPYEKQGRSVNDETYLAVVSRSKRGLPPRDEEVDGSADGGVSGRGGNLPWDGGDQGEARAGGPLRGGDAGQGDVEGGLAGGGEGRGD